MNQSPDLHSHENTRDQEERYGAPYHLLAAIIYPMIMFACQYAVSFFSAGLGIELHDNELLIIADIMIIAILLIWFACRGKSIPRSLSMNKVGIGRVLLGIAAGIGLSCALDYLMVWLWECFPALMDDYSEHMSSTASGSVIAYLLAGVILAPIVEELLFRALSVKHLDRALPRGLSIVLISGLFGLMHSHILQGLYAGSLGVLLCCLYFAYDSVWVPMAVHFGFNSVSILSLIDTAQMSDSQMFAYSCFLTLFSLIAVLGGTAALVVLFVQRRHSVWFKHRTNRHTAAGQSSQEK